MKQSELVKIYGLGYTEVCQFVWRAHILRSITKEEITLRRALTLKSTVQYLVSEIVWQHFRGFQADELLIWGVRNIFRRGLKKVGIDEV